jgi:hypothetical protein
MIAQGNRGGFAGVPLPALARVRVLGPVLVPVIALAIAAGPALAGAELHITSNAPARVLYDGEEIGEAPTSIRDVAPGFHELRVQSLASGESRVYDFYSPRTATVRKDVGVEFADAAASAAAAGPDDAAAVAGTSHEHPGQAASPERDAYEAGRRAEEERQKVRTRNTLLGAALANELLNRGSSKKTVRGVTLGGALLNEILRR